MMPVKQSCFLDMSTETHCHDCDLRMPQDKTLVLGKFLANLQHDALVQVGQPHQLPFWTHTGNNASCFTNFLAYGWCPDNLVLGDTTKIAVIHTAEACNRPEQTQSFSICHRTRWGLCCATTAFGESALS